MRNPSSPHALKYFDVTSTTRSDSGASLEKILLSAPFAKMNLRSCGKGGWSAREEAGRGQGKGGEGREQEEGRGPIKGKGRRANGSQPDDACFTSKEVPNLLVLNDHGHHLPLLGVLKDGNDLRQGDGKCMRRSQNMRPWETNGQGLVGVTQDVPGTVALHPCVQLTQCPYFYP